LIEFDKLKPMRRKKGFWIFLFVIGAIFGLTLIVMLLWNNFLVPAIAVSEISYWQAMGILILSKILFGFRAFGGPRHKGFGPRSKKWNSMSSEEKKEFKEAWKRRCEAKNEDYEKN
jgi:hypothetical protein